MTMERRSFLRGLLASTSVAAGTALVQLASPEEVATLKAAEPVLLGQPPPVPMPDSAQFIASGIHAYGPWPVGQSIYVKDPDGKFLQVGIISELHLERPSRIDLTAYSDDAHQYIRGLRRAWGRFELFASLEDV